MADEFTKAALYWIKTFNKKVKEKIWMQKLIELLNEYENTDNWENWHQVEFRESKIISKKFWFIEWLVENDKIEREKFWNSETKSSKYSDFELSYDTPREDYTNILLMELAIQDEPIQFLIEILR